MLYHVQSHAPSSESASSDGKCLELVECRLDVLALPIESLDDLFHRWDWEGRSG